MVTSHAINRIQERTGLTRKSSERIAEKAIKKGRNAESFPAKEREYLLRKEAEKGHWTVVYNNFCFIFSNDGTCITMLPLPKWFGKKQFDGKREIREAKKYIRFQDYYQYQQEDTEYGYGKVS